MIYGDVVVVIRGVLVVPAWIDTSRWVKIYAVRDDGFADTRRRK